MEKRFLGKLFWPVLQRVQINFDFIINVYMYIVFFLQCQEVQKQLKNCTEKKSRNKHRSNCFQGCPLSGLCYIDAVSNLYIRWISGTCYMCVQLLLTSELDRECKFITTCIIMFFSHNNLTWIICTFNSLWCTNLWIFLQWIIKVK